MNNNKCQSWFKNVFISHDDIIDDGRLVELQLAD